MHLTGSAVADFGFRPIVRSTDLGAPISTYTSPEGLSVKSYNDVVDAKRIYEALKVGSLFGDEMPHTTIRFDYRPSNFCDISTVSSNGVYGNYQANCYVAYISWLNLGDNSLFHEYGHAWSLYHAYVVQQDGDLTSYLHARGLAGDPRIGRSSSWSPREMIAEDYRQLFGTPNAAAGSQDNGEIPRASEVPGLREFLSGPFMQPPVAPPLPAAHAEAARLRSPRAGREGRPSLDGHGGCVRPWRDERRGRRCGGHARLGGWKGRRWIAAVHDRLDRLVQLGHPAGQQGRSGDLHRQVGHEGRVRVRQ